MKQHQQKIMTALLLILLVGWIGRHRIRNFFPPKIKFASSVLTNIEKGEQLRINDYKGKVVIVSLYQTWCADCARETPVLNQLVANINNNNFVVIYISDEPAEKVNNFRQRFTSDRILFSQSASGLKEFGIGAFPTTFLLDKNGKAIITKVEGYDWLQEEATIKKLMAD